jgi:hypothetical protein
MGQESEPVAIRVTFDSVPGYEYAEGREMWVQAPVEVTEASGSNGATPPPTFRAATLACTPYYDTDWPAYGPVDVYYDAIVPGASFSVQALKQSCNAASEDDYSAALVVDMSAAGDLVTDCGVQPCSAPGGVVDFVDISAVVDKFRNLPAAPRKARADLINSDIAQPMPDRKVDFVDISYCVDAFRGSSSPLPGPPITDPCAPAVKGSAGLRHDDPSESLLDPPLVVSLRPSVRKIHAGSTFEVDVYATGIVDLRTYQLSLVTRGGDTGAVTVEALRIDENRTDYVFVDVDSIAAVDLAGKRLGATTLARGVTGEGPVYLGTFMLRASPDASGEFNLDLAVASGATLFRDSVLSAIPFRLESAELVVVAAKDEPLRPRRAIHDEH